MSQEDFPIYFVLESIETLMASEGQPKVILFDIGGVCVSNDSFFIYTSRLKLKVLTQLYEKSSAQSLADIFLEIMDAYACPQSPRSRDNCISWALSRYHLSSL